MNFVTKLKQKENSIWAIFFAAVLCIVIGIFFDYYYDMNDDVLIKDILAGVYTGTPKGHNIQMLFPISFLLSLPYRIIRGVPWYGLFLCFCHFGCFYLLTERLLQFCSKRLTKVMLLLLTAVLIAALFLWELIFVQYTVTAALLTVTAAFLFYTMEETASVKDFYKKSLPSILLVNLAFCIRSEMLLLLLPLVCVTGICRWASEKPVFTKVNAAKYFAVFGGILAGLLLNQGMHMAAHGSEGWQEFNRFFDARTNLYDYQGIPAYEGNEAFYETIGLTEAEQMLLVNYNFGMDEEINAELMEQLTAYADSVDTRTFAGNLKNAIRQYIDRFLKWGYGEVTSAWDYRYRNAAETDYPWNLFILILYALVLVAAICNRRFRYLWELCCLGVVRSGLWLFILYNGRMPVRITYPLYLMEFVILAAMLLGECKSSKQVFRFFRPGFCIILALFALLNLNKSIAAVQKEYARREEVNRELQVLQSYTKEHPDSFYFVDVYSTVSYSEKMFDGADNSLSNYDIMGGWASKSPLMYEKYAQFSIETMEEALLTGEKVYVIVHTPQPAWLPAMEDWLPAYYEDRGIEVQMKEEDMILLDGQEIFLVYRVTR